MTTTELFGSVRGHYPQESPAILRLAAARLPASQDFQGLMRSIQVLTLCARIVCTAMLLLLGAGPIRDARAFAFEITESEWAWWPDFCKARYIDLGFGAPGAIRQIPSRTEIAAWRSQIGEDVFTYVHHHCAGLIWLQRARMAPNDVERDFALRSAEYESTFTLDRITPGSKMHADIVVHMGQIKRAAGDLTEALAYFERAIESRPNYAAGYLGKALVHRDRKDLSKVIEVLKQGSVATGGESRELEYHLGLALFDTGQHDAARVHARRAYALGFPLPALRERLAAAGFPVD